MGFIASLILSFFHDRFEEGNVKVLGMTPDILLMDEPSIALDPRNRKNLISILNEFDHLKLIASHDLDFIWDTCNRVVLMDQGKCIAQGPIGEVMTQENLRQVYGMDVYEWMRTMLSQWTEE